MYRQIPGTKGSWPPPRAQPQGTCSRMYVGRKERTNAPLRILLPPAESLRTIGPSATERNRGFESRPLQQRVSNEPRAAGDEKIHRSEEMPITASASLRLRSVPIPSFAISSGSALSNPRLLTAL